MDVELLEAVFKKLKFHRMICLTGYDKCGVIMKLIYRKRDVREFIEGNRI